MDYEKAFTDLEQSKKLAEILPLESADMRYASFGDIHPWVWDEEVKLLEKGSIPCWSLTALLGVLPFPSLHKTCYGWRCDSYLKDGPCCLFGENTDNPIDACVAAIGKLHERKLL